MLSIEEIRKLCRGFTMRDCVTRAQRIFYSMEDPAFWTDGKIAIFQPLKERYLDQYHVRIATQGIRRTFAHWIARATIKIRPTKGGKVHGAKRNSEIKEVVILQGNVGVEVMVNARYLRMFYVGINKGDDITFYKPPEDLTSPIIAKKNDELMGFLMPARARKGFRLVSDVAATAKKIAKADLYAHAIDVVTSKRSNLD